VGQRFPGIDWRVIRIVDEPIVAIDQTEELAPGEIGELIVRGPVVTTEYVTRRDANALAKIADLECGDLSPLSISKHREVSLDFSATMGSKAVTSYRTPNFWHRMGDCGYLDEQERFWFCGRMSQRVVTETGTLYTIPTEAQFNLLPNIARSALVGIGPQGRQQPAIVLETAGGFERHRLTAELRDTMRQTGVRHALVYPRSLPVDVRHNAKIGREQLAAWAEVQLCRNRSPRCVLLRDLT
jgi:acyl-CoA synthetase (AMP-forming)/AMP-acid ligase II